MGRTNFSASSMIANLIYDAQMKLNEHQPRQALHLIKMGLLRIENVEGCKYYKLNWEDDRRKKKK